MSNSSSVSPALAHEANVPPVAAASDDPISIRPYQHQDKESENEDDGSSVERTFSVLSFFSQRKRASSDSVFSVSTAQKSKMVSVALASGVGQHPFKTEKEKVDDLLASVTYKDKVPWWARIESRRTKKKGKVEFDEEDEKDVKALEEDDPDTKARQEDVYPDGGLQAWMVVLGGFLNTFSTFGFVVSWGIFQSYYQAKVLTNSSPSNIAWIGSIQYALGFLPALIVGRLFDLGYFHSIFLGSSILLVISTFLVPECNYYWQFLLCQGFGIGLATGGIFGPTMTVVAQWFKKRRGLAMGIVSTGSSLGGCLIPVIAKNLIGYVGPKWTMRIIGIMLIFTLGISNLIMRRRLPPKNMPGGLLNLAAFRSLPFTIYCISAFMTFLGLYTVLTYIDVAALNVSGMNKTRAFYLVSIANASSLVGRYASGWMCDRMGPLSVMIPSTAVAGVLTFIWPYVRTPHGLVALAVFYGFCSGSYVSLLGNPLMEMGHMDDLGRRMGMYMSILAFGALAGPPISGTIKKASGGYVVVGWYAGSMVLLGAVLMCIARWLVLRRWIGKF